MKTDGGLRQILQRHIPEAHWQSVETWSTGQGVPDMNYCLNGEEGWIELKKADHWRVDIKKQQAAWLDRRDRAGGRTFIFVRRADKELWIFSGASGIFLLGNRIDQVIAINMMEGGPAGWDWDAIKKILTR